METDLIQKKHTLPKPKLAYADRPIIKLSKNVVSFPNPLRKKKIYKILICNLLQI